MLQKELDWCLNKVESTLKVASAFPLTQPYLSLQVNNKSIADIRRIVVDIRNIA